MTTICSDVMAELKEHNIDVCRRAQQNFGLRSPLILYADDTAVVETSAFYAEQIVRCLQKHAANHGLHLHEGKCELVTNCDWQQIRLQGGQNIKRTKQTKYLGAAITPGLAEPAELGARLVEVWQVIRRLEVLWRKARLDKVWKIRIMQSIVQAKLLYGLETARATPLTDQKVDSMLAYLLRRILDLPSTYIDKEFSHDFLIQHANLLLSEHKHPPTCRRWSTVLKERRIRFLGHILRLGESDPCFTTTFADSDLTPRDPQVWRVGRPRTHWIEQVMSEAWALLAHGEHQEYEDSDTQRMLIMSAALVREGPFQAPD
jgi:hypothetical protein